MRDRLVAFRRARRTRASCRLNDRCAEEGKMSEPKEATDFAKEAKTAGSRRRPLRLWHQAIENMV